VRGEPGSDSQLIRDNGGGNWGWFQKFTFGEDYNGTQTLWAGAGQNNANNEGTFVGTAVVDVMECSSARTSTVAWDIPGDSGLCIQTGTLDVHVSLELPKNGRRNSFAPGLYKNGCCLRGQTCYVILHTSVVAAFCPNNSSATCSFDST